MGWQAQLSVFSYDPMNGPRGYFIPGSKGPVQYSYHGNIVGGIKNAKEFDVYIYDRSN